MSQREDLTWQPRDTLQRKFAPFMPGTSEMSSFFDKIFRVEVLNSIGVSSDLRFSYYNPDKWELSLNMIFKDNNDSIPSVKDYSVRVSIRGLLAKTPHLLSGVDGVFELLSSRRWVIGN